MSEVGISQMVEEAIASFQASHKDARPRELYDPIRYILDLGGKRLRPQLALMGASLFDADPRKALPAAVAVEVFHNFTLMHDDIMDNAPLRRAQPTVHEKWNANIAILSGDAMLVQAYQVLFQLPPEVMPPVLELFSKTAIEVCEGQQLDMNFEQRGQVSIAEYLHMIGLKTAVLLGCSLQMGALIAGAAKEDARALYDFGKYLGIAFQLQDDLLDVYGDPETFGKQVGGDILSNKKTFLILKALEIANRYQKEELEHWFSEQPSDGHAKVEAVRAIFDFLNIRELTQRQIEAFSAKALERLHSIPVAETVRKPLEDLAGLLMVRKR